MSTLYVLVPVTHQHPNVDWAREAPAVPRGSRWRSSPRIGMDDVERRIRFERMVTPGRLGPRSTRSTWARPSTWRTASRRCSTCGPRNRFEDLESVYLVGGGTHPGSGLPVIFESARITSRLLGEDLGHARSTDRRSCARPAAADERRNGICSRSYNDLLEVA